MTFIPLTFIPLAFIPLTFIPLAWTRRTGVGAAALLLGTAVWAQAPDQQSSSSRSPRLRQPTPTSVQRQDDRQTSTDQTRADADRKGRETDRRLDRTLRSICSGC